MRFAKALKLGQPTILSVCFLEAVRTTFRFLKGCEVATGSVLCPQSSRHVKSGGTRYLIGCWRAESQEVPPLSLQGAGIAQIDSCRVLESGDCRGDPNHRGHSQSHLSNVYGKLAVKTEHRL